MLLAVMLVLASSGSVAAPADAPARADPCAAVTGWHDGRRGEVGSGRCATAPDYAEAHRLGEAMRLLEVEHAAIALELPDLDAESRGLRLRRQRQIETDIEALRGVATIRGWPVPTPGQPVR